MRRVNTDVSVVVCGFIVLGPFVLAGLALGVYAGWLGVSLLSLKIMAIETLFVRIGVVGALIFLAIWVVSFVVWVGADKAR